MPSLSVAYPNQNHSTNKGDNDGPDHTAARPESYVCCLSLAFSSEIASALAGPARKMYRWHCPARDLPSYPTREGAEFVHDVAWYSIDANRLRPSDVSESTNQNAHVRHCLKQSHWEFHKRSTGGYQA